MNEQSMPEDLLASRVEWTQATHAERVPVSVSGIRSGTDDIDIAAFIEDRDLLGESLRMHEVVSVHPSDEATSCRRHDFIKPGRETSITAVRD
jgi:hypothetical protein